MFIDAHAHLTCDGVFEEIEPMLTRAKEAKVGKVINICTDKLTLERGIALAEKHSNVFNVGATTPHDVEKEGELYFSDFEKAAKGGKLVAIGETGLDYFYEHSNRELQQDFFKRYLALANACNLPVVIHCRDAFDDLFKIADEHCRTPLMLHCFTGTLKEANQGVDRGWLISISGIATFKKSQELRDVIKELPLDHLVVETDTPYLAPQSRRGKQNEPSFVVEIAETIATVKNLTLQEVATITTGNATRFFHCD